MAEKIETVITRGDQNTRPRDFYDIYILYELQGKNINYTSLRKAVQATAKNRNSIEIVENYKEIISIIRGSDTMQIYWKGYQKDFEYAVDIEFNETLKSLEEILELIQV